MEKPGKKVCTQCGEEKPAAEFSLRNASKDGLAARCKSCLVEYRRRYREENKEKLSANRRRYCEENKEKVSANKRRYREALPDPYVKRMLGATPNTPIPQPLIEAKRFHLRILRELRKD